MTNISKQNGKTKNKVLKLMATKLELMAKAAQGEDTSAKLAEELKKLNNNIALDKAAAGEPSTKLSFDATAGSGAVAEAATDDAAAADDTAADDTAAEDTADDDTEDEDTADDEEVVEAPVTTKKPKKTACTDA